MNEINQAANNAFLTKLLGRLHLKNDAALARTLNVAPPVISKLRHGRLDFGDTLIIRVHECAEMPVREIKQALGKASMAPHAANTEALAA